MTPDLVARSAAMRDALALAETAAATDLPVLVEGETGVGKERVARSIHQRSRRAPHAFVAVNCAAMQESLLESELFGVKRGAFTGAHEDRPGLFEAAHGGTLFLDEVGDLSLETQAKLLRVLQEGEFERLGSSKTRTTDVRVISATSRDLQEAIADGRFRADLFYRISVVPIEVPALRERREDIPALAGHFVARSRLRGRTVVEKMSIDALDTLAEYDWPGNVRELENVIERAMILSPGPLLELQDTAFRTSRASASRSSEPHADELAEIERAHIVEVLERCGGKVKGPGNAAERLGLNPSTLRNRMRKLGIERPRKTH
jgi:formate hydrogenlyase transcriptional activator